MFGSHVLFCHTVTLVYSSSREIGWVGAQSLDLWLSHCPWINCSGYGKSQPNGDIHKRQTTLSFISSCSSWNIFEADNLCQNTRIPRGCSHSICPTLHSAPSERLRYLSAMTAYQRAFDSSAYILTMKEEEQKFDAM